MPGLPRRPPAVRAAATAAAAAAAGTVPHGGWLCVKKRGRDDAAIERDRTAARERQRQERELRCATTDGGNNNNNIKKTKRKKNRGAAANADAGGTMSRTAEPATLRSRPTTMRGHGIETADDDLDDGSRTAEKLRLALLLRTGATRERKRDERAKRKRDVIMQDIRTEAWLLRSEGGPADSGEEGTAVTADRGGGVHVPIHVARLVTPDQAGKRNASDDAPRRASRKRRCQGDADSSCSSSTTTTPRILGGNRTANRTGSSGRRQAARRPRSKDNDNLSRDETRGSLTEETSEASPPPASGRRGPRRPASPGEERTIRIRRPTPFDGEDSASDDSSRRTNAKGRRRVLMFQDFATSASHLGETQRRCQRDDDPTGTIRKEGRLDRSRPALATLLRDEKWKNGSTAPQPVPDGDASLGTQDEAINSNQRVQSSDCATELVATAGLPCTEAAADRRRVDISDGPIESEHTVFIRKYGCALRQEGLVHAVKSPDSQGAVLGRTVRDHQQNARTASSICSTNDGANHDSKNGRTREQSMGDVGEGTGAKRYSQHVLQDLHSGSVGSSSSNELCTQNSEAGAELGRGKPGLSDSIETDVPVEPQRAKRRGSDEATFSTQSTSSRSYFATKRACDGTEPTPDQRLGVRANRSDLVEASNKTRQTRQASPAANFLPRPHLDASQVSILSLPRHVDSSSEREYAQSRYTKDNVSSGSSRKESQISSNQRTKDPLTDLEFWKAALANEAEYNGERKCGAGSFRNAIASLIIAKNEENQTRNTGFLWLPSLLQGGFHFR